MGLSARMVLAEVAQRCRRAKAEGERAEWRISLRDLSRELEETSHTTVSRAVRALKDAGVLTYRDGAFRLTRGVSGLLKPRSRSASARGEDDLHEEEADPVHTAPEYCTR